MKVFAEMDSSVAQERHAEHGGTGPIAFRRLMEKHEFKSAFDFVDLTVIPAGSTIGRHSHHGNEELYFVTRGEPYINVNGLGLRAKPGTLAVVRSGEWHELINDTAGEVIILVVQAAGVATP